jgi:hypothetical protein
MNAVDNDGEDQPYRHPAVNKALTDTIKAMGEGTEPLAKLHPIRNGAEALAKLKHQGAEGVQDALDHVSDMAIDVHGIAPDDVQLAMRQGIGLAEQQRTTGEPIASGKEKPRLRTLTAAEFLNLTLPPRKMILEPWLPEKGLAMIYSPRGVGKTLLGLTSAYAIAVGAAFIGFSAPGPRRVLYIDGEMPARTMQERLSAITKGFDRQPPSDEYFRILCADICEFGLPDLATVEGQARIDAEVRNADAVFVDNLSTLVRSGKENEAEGWLPIQEWALRHRRAGRSVALLHHAGKGGANVARHDARTCLTL